MLMNKINRWEILYAGIMSSAKKDMMQLKYRAFSIRHIFCWKRLTRDIWRQQVDASWTVAA